MAHKVTGTITIHGDSGHMAVNVKTHGMTFASIEGETEQFREWAWDRVAEQFWLDAKYIAQDCGYYEVVSEGRSDGWCVPHFTGGYPNPEDKAGCEQFLKFQRKIEKRMAKIPAEFLAELKAYVDYEYELRCTKERIIQQFCEGM